MVFIFDAGENIEFSRSVSIATVTSVNNQKTVEVNASLKGVETNISVSESQSALVITSDPTEYIWMNFESVSADMNGKLEKIDSDLSRINASLDNMQGSLKSLLGLQAQISSIDKIGKFVLGVLALVATLFWAELGSLNTRLYDLGREVSAIKTGVDNGSKNIENLKSEIKESKKETNDKLDNILDKLKK